ncbi:GNAT family N-acetyltransferase [Photobacterium sp. WH24]|uniref:GNAT family N-acetyltransferase n=1 Tax=Photobacterium sp. WH24 TaxID=2827237 RepID=UPI001C48520F|nr:GNAT family N-acetyltransferase [Photobacterium sp. WH24]MBV7263488.1 GNAT family N-acetyltransferase [Photobacterium sp. WH24]
MEMEKAAERHLVKYISYVNECAANGIKQYQAAVSHPETYLKSRIAHAEGLGLPEGWLPSTTFFCISHGEIAGAIRVRTGSNAYVENVIGHVGYETRPTARRQGVASFMLNWVCRHCCSQPLIITCSAQNTASRGVIERNGGRYLGSYTDAESGETVLRYQLMPIITDMSECKGRVSD